MKKHFVDFDGGDSERPVFYNMAIDSDDALLIRTGDNMAMDTGNVNTISP